MFEKIKAFFTKKKSPETLRTAQQRYEPPAPKARDTGYDDMAQQSRRRGARSIREARSGMQSDTPRRTAPTPTPGRNYGATRTETHVRNEIDNSTQVYGWYNSSSDSGSCSSSHSHSSSDYSSGSSSSDCGASSSSD